MRRTNTKNVHFILYLSNIISIINSIIGINYTSLSDYIYYFGHSEVQFPMLLDTNDFVND